jgi:hypothetical protein
VLRCQGVNLADALDFGIIDDIEDIKGIEGNDSSEITGNDRSDLRGIRGNDSKEIVRNE